MEFEQLCDGTVKEKASHSSNLKKTKNKMSVKM
jgi:hypothetical protein